MKKRLAVVGAFDRYNYGDVLFPLIVEHYVRSKGLGIDLDYFGLIASNMNKHGGKDTKSICRVLGSEEARSYDAFMIAGGGVIGTAWSNMFLHFRKRRASYWIYRVIFRVLRNKRNSLGRLLLHGKTRYPWVLGKEDVGFQSKIIYNAVGGSKPSGSDSSFITSSLSGADYVSFRDKDVHAAYSIDRASLSPDSATILPDLFDTVFLNANTSARTKQIVDCGKPFVCFQMNLNFAKRCMREAINQLRKIKEQGMEIMLLPLGYAAGHYDQIALKKMNELANEEFNILFEPNIVDTTYAIANSSGFIGSSLHGNLIAGGYFKPHIALRYENLRVSKLESYIDTWEIPDQKAPVQVGEIASTFEARAKIEKKELVDNALRLKRLVYENFDRMFELIE